MGQKCGGNFPRGNVRISIARRLFGAMRARAFHMHSVYLRPLSITANFSKLCFSQNPEMR